MFETVTTLPQYEDAVLFRVLFPPWILQNGDLANIYETTRGILTATPWGPSGPGKPVSPSGPRSPCQGKKK